MSDCVLTEFGECSYSETGCSDCLIKEKIRRSFKEQKTGHWIRITNGAITEKYICSKCGRQIKDCGIENLLLIKYPYCHCGAKMEGDKTEKLCCNCIHNKESEPTIENCATCYEQNNFTPKPEGEQK